MEKLFVIFRMDCIFQGFLKVVCHFHMLGSGQGSCNATGGLCVRIQPQILRSDLAQVLHPVIVCRILALRFLLPLASGSSPASQRLMWKCVLAILFIVTMNELFALCLTFLNSQMLYMIVVFRHVKLIESHCQHHVLYML